MENNIRNFVIIAHIDHGKSTLADRFLEITNTISQDKLSSQFLDKMSLEQEKGITIKMHPCLMEYVSKRDGKKYFLNLIDTPGHADFNYEVSRALKAVEGAILLVDVTQGIQAQTLANLYLAQNQKLKIIGCLNKVDLLSFDKEEVKRDLSKTLHIDEKDILMVSAKTGQGVEELLETVIEEVDAPKIEKEKPLKALIFDSQFDSFRGVLAFVRVFDGEIKVNDEIYLMANKEKSKVIECGVFKPNLVTTGKLSSGETG
jgi:GTP-binding protein LepA